MLDAWGLQALSAAALVIAGECERCVPPFSLQRGPLHTTQYRARAHNHICTPTPQQRPRKTQGARRSGGAGACSPGRLRSRAAWL